MAAFEPRAAGRWLAALVVVQVTIVWVMPVVPAQDLPQHLAYARILMDHGRPDLLFNQLYTLPERFQLYFTTHYLLAGLGSLLSLQVALKLLLSAYVAGVMFGFRALVAACTGARRLTETRWTALLGCLVVWGPAACLGLLPFMMAMPGFFFASALLVRLGEGEGARRERWWLGGWAVLISTLHPVAGACLAVVAVLHVAVNPHRRRLVVAFVGVGAVTLTILAGALAGDSGLGSRPTIAWGESMRKLPGVEFLNDAFRIVWHDPLEKLNQVQATLLGPYRWSGQLLVASALGGLAWIALRHRPRSNPQEAAAEPRPTARTAVRRTAIALALVSWLMPSGIMAPTELLFVDLRLVHLAGAFLLALVDPRWFQPLPVRRTLVVVSCVITLHFGIRSLAFAAEARPALALLERAQPLGMMLPLTLHHRSAHFGGQFRLTHFLPMYYTVDQGGPSAQFWGRYTDHLPVGYRPGAEPLAPADWASWEVRGAQLRLPAYVLLARATDEDPERERAATTRIESLIRQTPQLTLVDCAGNWCLYRNRGAR